MPGKLRKVKGGYRWPGGKRTYKTKKAAHRAAYYERKKRGKRR